MSSFHPNGNVASSERQDSLFPSLKLNLLLLVLGGAWSVHSHAQSMVHEVVVSASRTSQRIEDATSSTTLISREDIERSVSTDLPSLLQLIPGTEISQAGGTGTVSSIFLRGAESRHTLVLVDGVPINNLNFGTAPLENLSLSNIDHIEIVRGNVSSLYGSNAMGGVIQIFTKEMIGKNPSNLSYQVRNNGLTNAQAGTSIELSEDTRLTLQTQILKDAGFNSTNQSQFISSNPDRDGYSKKHFSTGLSKKIENGQINFTFADSHSNTEYDSQYGPSTQRDLSENTLRQSALSGHFSIASDIMVDALLSQSLNRLNANITAYPYFVDSNTDQANLGLVWTINDEQKITSGIENTKQSLLSDTQYKKNSRLNNAFRLGYLINANKHQAQLNIREDHYSDFGQAQTGLFSYAYKLNEALRFNATNSSGFMAPTFNDLYYPYGGNPTLRPEKLQSNEFGLSFKQTIHTLQITRFKNQYTDLIDNDSNYVRTNISKAQNIGVESIYSGNFKNRLINASYTQQNPINLNSNQQLNRRAKYLFSLSIFEKFNAYLLGTEVKHASSRLDGGNQKLNDYTLVNFSISKKIDQNWTSSLKLNNAFDRKYETIYGYNQLGRSLFFEMKWQDK
jgi:vitamin B12 transporter